jgi:hypothetical protein
VTPLQATELVYETVRTGWTACVVSHENETWTPPRNAASIRCIVQELPGATITHGPTGDRVERNRAVILAQVFVPKSIADGVAVAKGLRDQFAALLKAKEIVGAAATYPNSIQTDAAQPRGGRSDGDMYQLNVEVPFTFDQLI